MRNTLTAEEKAYIQASKIADQKYAPRYTVCMTGANSAIVAEQQIHLLENGSEIKRCRWLEMERHHTYWRWWDGREWRQLFGKYGTRGNAMEGDLPGRRVHDREDLPLEGDVNL